MDLVHSAGVTPEEKEQAGQRLERLIEELSEKGHMLPSGEAISKTSLGRALGRQPPYDTINKWCAGRGFSRLNQHAVEQYLGLHRGYFAGAPQPEASDAEGSTVQIRSDATAGELLREAREIAGFTTDRFAKILRLEGGVDELDRMERGDQTIDSATRDQIASLLGVSEEEIFRDGRYPTHGGGIGVESREVGKLLDEVGIKPPDQRFYLGRLIKAANLDRTAALALAQAFARAQASQSKGTSAAAR